MIAVRWSAYGPPEVLVLTEQSPPTPTKNQLLIKVLASSVTSGDCRLRGCRVPPGFRLLTRLAFGLFKPCKPIPGMNLAGEVVATGPDVKAFSVGDRVYGSTGMALGANAEFTCVPETAAITKIPNSINYNDAVAIIFGGLTALDFLSNKVSIKANTKLLVNGASGSVGCAAISLAKHFGAQVTAICSAENHSWVRNLGADHCIDYKKVDFTQEKDNYDIILDTVGNLDIEKSKLRLTSGGKLILISCSMLTLLRAQWDKQLVCGVAGESKAMLDELLQLFAKGVLRPVIDRQFPLADIVAAHQYVDGGHKKGNVVITHAPAS